LTDEDGGGETGETLLVVESVSAGMVEGGIGVEKDGEEGGVERGGLEVEGGDGRAADGAGGTVVEGTLETLCAEGVLAGDDGARLEEELVADVAGELLLDVLVLGEEGLDVCEGDVVCAVGGCSAEGTGDGVAGALGVTADERGR